MKIDIIITGVGGQGILTIAAAIATAAMRNNLRIKQSEVHGMSQRGGDVQANLRISDSPVASDLIPKGQADLVISLEPMESLRYIHYLKPNGQIVTTATPFVNIPNYPDEAALKAELEKYSNITILPLAATTYANIILLGASSHYIPLPRPQLEESLRILFARKGDEIVNANLQAFNDGYAMIK